VSPAELSASRSQLVPDYTNLYQPALEAKRSGGDCSGIAYDTRRRWLGVLRTVIDRLRSVAASPRPEPDQARLPPQVKMTVERPWLQG
jgi:hypothetical protein